MSSQSIVLRNSELSYGSEDGFSIEEIREVTILDSALMTLASSSHAVIAKSFERISGRRFSFHAISGIVDEELVELVADLSIEFEFEFELSCLGATQ